VEIHIRVLVQREPAGNPLFGPACPALPEAPPSSAVISQPRHKIRCHAAESRDILDERDVLELAEDHSEIGASHPRGSINFKMAGGPPRLFRPGEGEFIHHEEVIVRRILKINELR
jgi:hypothetical protein